MENISKMEMATALFNQIYIKTEKTFFGLKTKVTYAPTNSPVVGNALEFAPAEGQKVKAILEASPAELDAVLQKNGRPQTGENGNMKLNICYSRDHEFAAFHLQLFARPRICGIPLAAILRFRIPHDYRDAICRRR